MDTFKAYMLRVDSFLEELQHTDTYMVGSLCKAAKMSVKIAYNAFLNDPSAKNFTRLNEHMYAYQQYKQADKTLRQSPGYCDFNGYPYPNDDNVEPDFIHICSCDYCQHCL